MHVTNRLLNDQRRTIALRSCEMQRSLFVHVARVAKHENLPYPSQLEPEIPLRSLDAEHYNSELAIENIPWVV